MGKLFARQIKSFKLRDWDGEVGASVFPSRVQDLMFSSFYSFSIPQIRGPEIVSSLETMGLVTLGLSPNERQGRDYLH